MHRLPEPDRWSKGAVQGIRALSGKPNPNAAESELAPRMNIDPDGARADGADLGEPDCAGRISGPREMRLTSRLFTKYGHTEGCLGCANKQAGLYDHRQHSLA